MEGTVAMVYRVDAQLLRRSRTGKDESLVRMTCPPTCIDFYFACLHQMKETGITLPAFSCLAKCQGLDVDVRFASDTAISDFRNAVRLACVEDPELSEDTVGPFLVVSYDRRVLDQTGTGHFSPIGGYDEKSDKLLIFDTARFKYGAHWVPLPLLFKAMLPVDPVTKQSRGYVLLSCQEDEGHSVMPQSLLFRTCQRNHAVRQEYKEFLKGLNSTPPSWEDVLLYWTQRGRAPKYIWEMTKTQLTPIDDKDQTAIASIRRLISDLMSSPSAPPDSQNDCHFNARRTIFLNPEEAIFVVYLASLDVDRRRSIVLDEADTSESVETKEQLLAEAELLQLAIEMSDKLDNVQ